MTSTQLTVPSITSQTNLGALTTSISFPPNCLNNLYDLQTTGLGVTWTYETQGCAVSTCCPSNKFYTVGWGWLSSYYSPAVCPSQYKSCAPYTGLSTSAGETAILCCPENYECPGGTAYWACQSGLTSDTIVTVLSGIYNQRSLSTRQFVATPDWTSYQVAYPIQIRFKANELSTSGTDTIVVAAATPTNSAGVSFQSTPSSTSFSGGSVEDTSRSRRLSSGARAGIGVGVSIAFAVILAIIAWAVRAWRRNRVIGKSTSASSSQSIAKAEESAVFDEPKPWNGQAGELRMNGPHEVPAKTQATFSGAYELEVPRNGPGMAHELH